DELLLERLRKAAVAEVPAVKLLQEADRTLLAELSHRLANEDDELRGHLLARRAERVALGDLAQRPWVPLRAAGHHHGCRSGLLEYRDGLLTGGDVARRDHRDADPLDELRSDRVVGLAGVHLLRRARVKCQSRRAGLHQPRSEL